MSSTTECLATFLFIVLAAQALAEESCKKAQPPVPTTFVLDPAPNRASYNRLRRAFLLHGGWRFDRAVELPSVTSDLPGQPATGCGLYASAILLAALDQTLDAVRLESIQALDPAEDGTNATEVAAYLSEFYAVDWVGCATTTQLLAHLDRGNPALLVVKASEKGTHWVVLSGYRTTDYHPNRVSEVRLVDNGVLEGTYSWGEFLKHWRFDDSGRCLFLYPNAGRLPMHVQLQGFHFLPGTGNPGSRVLEALFAAAGHRLDFIDWWNFHAKLDPEKDGFSFAEAQRFLSSYFDLRRSEYTSPQMLAAHIDEGFPVLVSLNSESLYAQEAAPPPSGIGLQWALIHGYTTDFSRRFVSWDVCHAHQTPVPHELFMAAWHRQQLVAPALFLKTNDAKLRPAPHPFPGLQVNDQDLVKR